MATAENIFGDVEDDDDTNDSRYFDIPYADTEDKSYFSSILNSPLLIIEETIKPFEHLVDDVATKLYLIKQQLIVNDLYELTLDELSAIHLYIWERSPFTTSISYLINETIRRGFTDEFRTWTPYLNLLFTSLNKLLPIEPHSIVYSGVRSCNLSSQYKDNEIYTWWTFTTCLRSIDQIKLPHYLGKSGLRTLFKIECYSGKQVPFSDEDEVILMPGFHFQVIGQLPLLDDLTTIFIREIPPSSNEIFQPISSNMTQSESREQVLSSVKKIKSRKTFKHAANRIRKMSKAIHFCSNHILDLSGRKCSMDFFKFNLNERLTEDVTILNLSKTSLTKEKIKIIAQVLQANSTLIELNLSYNSIGNFGCSLLTHPLQKNRKLITLNLYNTKLSSDAAQDLSKILMFNHHLQSLHLGVNALSNLGMKYLLNDQIQLQYLNICCNRINQHGCIHLAQFLEHNRTLKQLDIGGNPIEDNGMKIIFNGLINNETLIDLRMWHCQITDFQIIYNLFETHSTLKQLDFEGNQITDVHTQLLISFLENNKTLERINLSHNRISDKVKETLQLTNNISLVI
ncbi:unnamed protein product [Adineta ricciae]|uniref:Mono(ADP-ribosyl)transferase n=1 Tax=Adineta ricciae TaxID=249248 RepID=A0A813WNP0_ADIRI|nr:unnamed protein product [Adineta ricciae]CAF1430864.1 unnamed protein product [Adineta ricciae]